MGCAISKVHKRIIDSTKNISSVNIEVVDIHSLSLYFANEDNPNPKCIFIFGGSGSNKGEFIWQLLQQYESVADSENIAYHYIDVEQLIMDNLGKRIKKLTQDKSMISPITLTNKLHKNNNNNEMDNISEHNGHNKSLSDANVKTFTISSVDDLKTKMLLYANVITNSWILSLITKEIDKLAVDSKERVFIINLIPNRINLFRNCLYLKQAPSFVNFHFSYIAINLIKNTSKRKDLDQLTNNCNYDEVNNNFINYFRLINKLVEIKVDLNPAKIKLKLTKNSKNSIKIESKDDVLSLIYAPKRDGMEIDINGFEFNDTSNNNSNDNINCNNKSQNGLTFMISNEIEIDENYAFVFDENDFSAGYVRKFTQFYCNLKDSVNKCSEQT